MPSVQWNSFFSPSEQMLIFKVNNYESVTPGIVTKTFPESDPWSWWIFGVKIWKLCPTKN